MTKDCDSDLPIACNLSDPEFQKRRSGLLREVGAAVLEQKELADGYGYRFPSDARWIAELSKLITAERECCPFLRFTINVEPGEGPIWLELTGPEGLRISLTRYVPNCSSDPACGSTNLSATRSARPTDTAHW